MIALALILAIVALSYAEEPLENDVANVEPAAMLETAEDALVVVAKRKESSKHARKVQLREEAREMQMRREERERKEREALERRPEPPARAVESAREADERVKEA